MDFICEWCGKEFKGYPSRTKWAHICCSRECASNLRKFNNLNATCPICGNRFHVKPYHQQRFNTVCCSMDCSKEFRRRYMLGEGNHQFGLKGDKNSSWKSDVRINEYGYRLIRMLDHPFKNKSDFVLEHRLVAEQYLLTEENSIEVDGKRYLKKEYDVHHIDGNKLNNDKSNLLVLTRGEHTKLHNEMRAKKQNKKPESEK